MQRCCVHTFLFQEGLWEAQGEYIDEAMNRFVLRGETRVSHHRDAWLNEGRMTIQAGEKTIEFESRYRVVPFAERSDITTWESDTPALGTLRGHFIVVGDSILSSCTSLNARYTGTEFFLQESPDRYVTRGALCSEGEIISSWSLTLVRKGSDG